MNGGKIGGAAPALPEELAIFPLAGVLLLPRGRLPLNIFEPRYLAMTRDALGGERLIGMIQPSDPAAEGANPPVYPVGCAGRITEFAETEDGRLLLTLTGVSRFRIRSELPRRSGYRRVVPDWDAFAGDRGDAGEAAPGQAADRAGDRASDMPGLDRARLVRGLRAYFTQHQLAADWTAIEAAPGEHLVISIAMLCPFAPGEKQALLEAADLAERARVLTAIVEMAAAGREPDRSKSGRFDA
jgi:hypothetical protein